MNKRGVSLILLILALAILFFIIVAVMSYFFFSKTDNKEINSIEFVLIDKSGREYLYSTNEGVNELSISGET